jgi:hypothetical protein
MFTGEVCFTTCSCARKGGDSSRRIWPAIDGADTDGTFNLESQSRIHIGEKKLSFKKGVFRFFFKYPEVSDMAR